MRFIVGNSLARLGNAPGIGVDLQLHTDQSSQTLDQGRE